MANVTWIEHDGSDTPPVADDVLVIVKLRDGNASNVPHPAGEMFWGVHAVERQRKFDIVAYYLAT